LDWNELASNVLNKNHSLFMLTLDDGNVIGMNFYDTRIGTPFLLWEVIYKILASFKTKRYWHCSYQYSSIVLFWSILRSLLKHNRTVNLVVAMPMMLSG
jgi:hypothetical protein